MLLVIKIKPHKKESVMFRYILLMLIVSASSFSVAAPIDNGCPISRAEKLVCSVVLCNPLGLAIAESRTECLKINRDYAIYLATLGFWKKPPRCQARDENCNRTGRASTAQMRPENCLDAGDRKKQNACMIALNATTEGYCDQFNLKEKVACESVQQTGRVNEEYCDKLAEELSPSQRRFLLDEELVEKEARYARCLELK